MLCGSDGQDTIPQGHHSSQRDGIQLEVSLSLILCLGLPSDGSLQLAVKSMNTVLVCFPPKRALATAAMLVSGVVSESIWRNVHRGGGARWPVRSDATPFMARDTSFTNLNELSRPKKAPVTVAAP